MRNELTVLVQRLTTFVILGLVFLTPLFFTNLTTEYYEIPKLALLSISTSVLLLLWGIQWIIKGKVTFIRTPFDLSLLFLLLVIVLSSLLTDSRYVAIYGNFPRVHGSAISWITYIIFYFIAVSHFKGKAEQLIAVYVLMASATIAGVLSILAYSNIHLLENLLPFTKAANFTPTGSSFSTSALLLLLLPFTLVSIFKPNKFIPLPAALVLSTLFGIIIVLIGTPWIKILLLVIVVLSFLTLRKDFSKKTAPFILIPIVLSGLVFSLGFLTLDTNLNVLKEQRLKFPYEVQLPFLTSWKISVSSFRDKPFFGTGPSTYLYDFTLYRPIEHNLNPYWNVRFDNAFNEYLQTLGTLGLIGLLALSILSALILAYAKVSLQNADDFLVNSLAISSVAVVLLMLIHTTTLVSIFASIIILALLVAAHKTHSGKIDELSLGIQASTLTDSKLVSNIIVGDILPIILIVPIALLLIFVLWNARSVLLADNYHRQALNSASKNSLDTYNNLVKAEQHNPYIDLYRTDLAQTNFALANALAQQKGPTESSPGGSLTDQDKQTIQRLISQAITEAQVATRLAPRSAQNWEILASIYRQISGVAQNALQFSLDAYGKAVAQDPYNPLLRLNIGGVYYSIRNYDLAVRFFGDAANLKPDFANAYYNLSVALKDKGDLRAARISAERVVSLLDPAKPDYKIAAEYLTDLKARIATGSGQTQPAKPPAAEEKAALQKKDLPKVVNLPEPSSIATPSAIPNQSLDNE